MFAWWLKHAMLHLIELKLFQVCYYSNLWDLQSEVLKNYESLID